MLQPRFLSVAEQVAEHLREELLRGRWKGTMPGMNPLAAELGVDDKTVEVALRQLEREGLLVARGRGCRRLIPSPRGGGATRPLRVAILLSDRENRQLDYMIELQHTLADGGHVVIFPEATLVDLGMDVPRVARLVERTAADAWVVFAASREVLEWFAARPEPAFALAGRMRRVAIAGAAPDKVPATRSVVRRLVELGHRRVVLLARPRRRLPDPGAFERAFLEELAAHGISTGPYNLPAWEETIEGFHKRLNSLFRITAPTALIIDEAPFFFATLQFLLKRGMGVPEDLSLVCTDADPGFAWCRPTVAHIRWDSRPIVRRIVRWAADAGGGRKDLRQTLTRAEFVEGGTIGPAAN